MFVLNKSILKNPVRDEGVGESKTPLGVEQILNHKVSDSFASQSTAMWKKDKMQPESKY